MDPTAQIKDAGRRHRCNSLYCSLAAYQDYPDDVLNKDNIFQYHQIDQVCWGKHGDQRIVMAISKPLNSLYVAFSGTAKSSDWDTNIKLAMKKLDHYPGKCHQGYTERAMTLSPSNIAKFAEENNIDTIVTCGHSMGGAVSTITALRLMEIKQKTKAEILNITFGSPYIGNSELLRYCQRAGIANKFLHYVNNQDPVPNILSLGSTMAHVLQKFEKSIPDVARPFYETAKSFLHQFKPFLDGLMAVGNLTGNEKFGTISTLYHELTSPEEESSLQSFPEKDRYVPNGFYLIMIDDNSCWIEANNPEIAKKILGICISLY